MSDLREQLALSVEELTAVCEPGLLHFETTDDLTSLDAVFGQERAVRAIEFALGMKGKGYNLYASGPDGIGKSTIVESFLRRRAAQLPAPSDWVYVHNFEDPDRPLGIELPSGGGRQFALAVERITERASQELQQAFESDSYIRQRQELGHGPEGQRAELLEELRGRAKELGFALQMTPQGIVSTPLINDQPVPDEVLQALPKEQQEAIQERAKGLEEIVQDMLLKMRGVERDAIEQLEQLDEQVARFAVEHLFQPLIDRWGEDPEVRKFLEAVRNDMRKERDRLRATTPSPSVPQLPRSSPEQQREQLLRRYQVNALISNDPDGGAPVITERHPSYYNLLGRIEYVGQFGTAITDHTMIRAGSLGLAHGGFLLLRLRDLLQNTVSYEGLKRALTSGELAIENLSESLGLVPTTGLRPEPMPLDVKVVIVGDASLYSMLYRLDPDFRELFRIKADFEVDFERNESNIAGLASLIRAQCDRGGMRCFEAGAVGRMIEHSSRMVGDQRRLSGNMSELVDLIRQADFWAAQHGDDVVQTKHVEQALEERDFRSSLVRDRLQLMIDDGTLFIDTAGSEVGQINALSVYDLGDITFGRPSRITCVTSAGRGTIVNIERETNMAGRTHNKGFLILRGFLAARFGQHRAMALHASLTFEQLYGDIDGDSASSTELYALLSSLSNIPIDQSIAVTGSLNQHGEIQPIGGATAKIEGFYEVCRSRGLDGTQGVMIPRANVTSVVLRPEVAGAIEDGTFHVWAASTIEEGIEILTGVPAGERDEDGHFPAGTVFRAVEERLDEFEQALKGEAGPTPETPQITVPAPAPGDGTASEAETARTTREETLNDARRPARRRSLTWPKKKAPITKMKSPLMARNRHSAVVCVVAHRLVKKVSLLVW